MLDTWQAIAVACLGVCGAVTTAFIGIHCGIGNCVAVTCSPSADVQISTGAPEEHVADA